MKKINKIIIIFLLATGLLSCDELLTESPKTTFYPGNIFVNETGVLAVLHGVYDAAKKHTYGASASNSHYSDIILIGTDEGATKWNTSYRYTFDSYTYGVEEGDIYGMWVSCYDAISRSNVLLAGVSNSDLDAGFIKKVVAEAKFIRAFTYFKMVQLWGPVPLVLETSDEGESPRAPLKDIYSQIISDLTEIIESDALPESVAGEYSRVTVYAAHTLLAKIYMTIASYKKYGNKVEGLITDNGKEEYGYAAIDLTLDDLYTKALQQINAIISSGKFSLMQNYCDVFRIANKNATSENIWEMQFASFSGGGSRWSKSWGIQAWQPGSGGIVDPRGWQGYTELKPNPVFYEYFSDGDMRREWNFPQYRILTNSNNNYEITGISTFDPRLLYREGATAGQQNLYFNSYGMGKYRWSDAYDGTHDGVANQTNTNGIVYRYADVLLMYAECLMAQNNGIATQDAVDAVNLLRNRARRSIDPAVSPGQLLSGMGLNLRVPIGDSNGSEDPATTPSFPNLTTNTLNMDVLMKERACELCFEHHRKYDLLRWEKLQEVLAQRLPNDYRLFVGGSQLANLEDYKLLWPIPQKERDAVVDKEGLYQNSGW